jgi:hypothetical protein
MGATFNVHQEKRLAGREPRVSKRPKQVGGDVSTLDEMPSQVTYEPLIPGLREINMSRCC